MAHEDDVNRAVGIIKKAIQHGMFPIGVMPESDTDKLVEAEKLVALATQAETLADAIGKGRVKNWDAIRDILFEARVLVGANGDTADVDQPQSRPQQEAQSSASSSSVPSAQQSVSASASPGPTTSASVQLGQPLTPVPAASASSSSVSSPPTTTVVEQPRAVEPRPVSPDGIMAEPQVNEEWSAAGAGRWLVLRDLGGQLEVLSRATNETAVVPTGFLKQKVTEAFVQVEVDPDWNLRDAKGYNTLWFCHPGCAKWFVPLDDMQLPPVGQVEGCPNCGLQQLPIVTVEPNGYVPPRRPTEPEAPPAQAVAKQQFITLTAHPDRGVKTYEHPGCSSWDVDLGGKPLLAPGVQGQCATCGEMLVLKNVDANGYDPATWQPSASRQEEQPSAPPPSQPSPASSPEQPTPRPTTPDQESAAGTASVPSSTASPSPSAAPSSPSGLTERSVGSAADGGDQPSSTSSPSSSGSASVSSSSSSSPLSAITATGTGSRPASSSSSHPSSPPSGSPASSSSGAPVEHHEGDDEYARILDQAESDFLPTGMPAPQDLERPPAGMPEDLTANPEANRALHSQFNALAARARYLASIEERIARDCGRAVRLRLRPHLAKAKKELGASSTLTERREWAEEIAGDDVRVWLERQQKHADRAEAYREFFHIYNAHVAVLSRDLTWAQNEERGA